MTWEKLSLMDMFVRGVDINGLPEVKKNLECVQNVKVLTGIGPEKGDLMAKEKIEINKIYPVDCVKFMPKLQKESVDLIITDPPFNIGKKYNSYKDRMKKEEYISWCKSWLKECIRILKPHGSLYLFNYPENNAYLIPFLDKKMIFKRWLTWHYPTNTGMSPKSYTRSQHSILFYTKTENSIFNKNEIAEPYRNPTDKRIKKLIASGKKGKTPYDVFNFNIVKNVSREKTEHVCQLPEKLVEIFIKASSNKGDLVFDPFMGSGTVAAVAKKLGRDYSGCEIDKKYCKIIDERLKNVIPKIDNY